jgi:katanin p60 ATPase-containing subunit A1
MKTELLIQMDGVKGRSTVEQQVFVMAASNLPWDLDIAVLRRLEKRVLVPLPEKEARELMFRKHISDRVESSVDFDWVTKPQQ